MSRTSAPAGGLRYHRLLALGARGGWRPVVGLVVAMVVVFGAQLFVVQAVAVALAVSGLSIGEIDARLSGEDVTPLFLAVVNLGWALAIPAIWLVVLVTHRLRPGWVASVAGRMRWRWLLLCMVVAFGALLATVVVSSALPSQGDAGVELTGSLNPWTDQVRDFLLVIVLLTPLQAAGEEYVFRGYLAQALGGLSGWAGERVAMAVAVVVPAMLFALAHGAQDPPIFFDRFAFGVVAGVLVLLTGGLEAGIAMHVLNNFLAFGIALAFGDMTTVLTPTDGTWWSIPVTLTQSLLYLTGCLAAARWMGVADRSESGAEGPEVRAVLEPPTPRV